MSLKKLKNRLKTLKPRKKHTVQEADPIKQGLKLWVRTRCVSTLTSSRSRSNKTRIETTEDTGYWAERVSGSKSRSNKTRIETAERRTGDAGS